MNYPATRRDDLTEEHFGMSVADPYRWLEADARSTPDVAAWVAAQDGFARAQLARLPGRQTFRERLRALFDHERLTVPHRRGKRYFFTRNAGLDDQAKVIVRDGVNGAERVLIDPSRWSADGATALAEWSPSADGNHLAFAVQNEGTDWRTIRVLDVDRSEVLADEIAWARFTAIAWAADGSGFFYSRFPEPMPGATSQTPLSGHAVYFHALHTAQRDDRLVYSTPAQPQWVHVAGVTDDGRYVTIYSSAGAGGSAPTLIDLTQPDGTPRTLVPDFDHDWSVIGNVGTRVFLTTQRDAERGKVVALDLSDPDPVFADVVPHGDAVLNDASLLGNRLIVCYLVDAKTQVKRYGLDGRPDGTLELPGIGSAGGFRGRADDDEAFFAFSSYDTPTSIWRYDVATHEKALWAEPKVAIDLDRIAVEQRFYASKDGTRVPMFIVRRKDSAGPAPTLLYAYGGHGISALPVYLPAFLAWVEQGGVVAVANLRGGGEYGKAWHDAGRGRHKQNTFDDLIAAAEFLKAEGIAADGGLAVHGESNGGLVVGAVVNQRPELFAAALAGVGVMDMLRFDRFTAGALWIGEFGDPAKEADFRHLLGYSPYHNIRPGQAYPAVLVTTADSDDRVVPAHSFKYAAALQAADLGERPRLLRVDQRAGHGAGKPLDKTLDEVADLWAFAAYWTGLEVGR